MLVDAPGMSERRAAFDALTQMTQGTEQLVQMLDHHEWFVVRNVAELVGELGMEDAIPALSRRSEEHTSELQSQSNLVCRLLLEKNNGRQPRFQFGPSPDLYYKSSLP